MRWYWRCLDACKAGCTCACLPALHPLGQYDTWNRNVPDALGFAGAVGVHEESKDPERVFGTAAAAGDTSDSSEAKVRPLGFYFRKDIPKDLKHRGADSGLPPEEVNSSSLEHLQAVAKHKASKGAAGGAGLGFYFSKDARTIAHDVEAKPSKQRARRLSWLPRAIPVFLWPR